MFRGSLLCCLAVSLTSTLCFATPASDSSFHHPFFMGALGGYGATTWNGLVPPTTLGSDERETLSLSTPSNVTEGGSLWGVFAGYEFLPSFALEAHYMHYPDATIAFNEFSIFSFMHEEATTFITQTETVSLMGKVMLTLPRTAFRIYSSVGLTETHRKDLLLDQWRPAPSFGVGINHPLTEHFMAELGGLYTAGFGQSELNPSNSYIPFLYAAVFRLAYCY